MKAEPKAETNSATAVSEISREPFSDDQLREAWHEFAAGRRHLQAEHQMLSQAYTLRDNVIIVTLLSPVHETLLDNIKVELTAFLRERLRNNLVQVTGELTTTDDRKVIYTNRDKFEYLAAKNPILKELKNRLGLDPDF